MWRENKMKENEKKENEGKSKFSLVLFEWKENRRENEEKNEKQVKYCIYPSSNPFHYSKGGICVI